MEFTSQVETSSQVEMLSHEGTSNQVVSETKKGRIAKSKKDASRSWTDNEVFSLIEIWSEYENLYNTKHKNYFNRDTRHKSLSSVERNLKEHGIIATVKQIGKKLTDLKNYYGGQRRLVETSKSSGAGTDEVYVSPWKFYERLEFLSDAFNPRKTKSNADREDDDGSPYVDASQPSAKTSKKLALAQNNELHKVMSTAATALESVISSNKNQKPREDDTDDTFGKLVVGQLKLIPECDLKDELKISLQQLILRCKREVNSTTQTQSYFATRNSIPLFTPQRSPLSTLSSPQSYSSSSSSFGL